MDFIQIKVIPVKLFLDMGSSSLADVVLTHVFVVDATACKASWTGPVGKILVIPLAISS